MVDPKGPPEAYWNPPKNFPDKFSVTTCIALHVRDMIDVDMKFSKRVSNGLP